MGRQAFSLIEVVLAIGIIAFALSAMLALLPLGVETNQNAAESVRGAGILTALEADLRNSYPDSASKSMLFQLLSPYKLDTKGALAKNDEVFKASNHPKYAEHMYTVGLNTAEDPVNLDAAPRPRYQVTVIYLPTAVTGRLTTTVARMVVSWPAQPNATTSADLTNPAKVSGYVETYASFPAP